MHTVTRARLLEFRVILSQGKFVLGNTILNNNGADEGCAKVNPFLFTPPGRGTEAQSKNKPTLWRNRGY